jgi:hypothetical protein
VEIPVKGDPAYLAATAKFEAALAKGNFEGVVSASKAINDSCQTATEQPVFILYHDTIKPQMLHLTWSTYRPTKIRHMEIADLGITPVADKPFMYRLTPKHPLSKDVYILVGSVEFASNNLACFMVGTPEEIYGYPKKTHQ